MVLPLLRLNRKPGKETWPDTAGWMLFTAAFETKQIGIMSQTSKEVRSFGMGFEVVC